MIPTWFEASERVAALDASAASWIGTPFGQNGSIKGAGGGVSCQKLAASLFFEAGFLKALNVPAAPMNWAQHNRESIIVPFMDAHPSFSPVPMGEPIIPGDVLGFRIGFCVHHMGVVVTQKRFVHVWRHAGVLYSLLHDPNYSKRIEKVWRPKP